MEMEALAKSEMFFLITTVAVTVVAVLLSYLLYYLIKIVRATEKIVKNLEKGSGLINENISKLHNQLFGDGVLSFIIRTVNTAIIGFGKINEQMSKTDLAKEKSTVKNAKVVTKTKKKRKQQKADQTTPSDED